MTSFVYWTFPSGFVHASTQDNHRTTVCGIFISFKARMGDETVSGLAVDCLRCKRIIKREAETGG